MKHNFKQNNGTSKSQQLTSSAAGSASASEYSSSRQPPPTTTGGRLKQAAIVALFAIGLIVCVSSLACILLLPQFVTNQIAKRLVLKNNSLLLERWSKPNVPMFFKVWLFDVKNSAEVLAKRGTKPRLEEVGPFVFRLKRQKDVVSFAGDNLYYTERKIYHFDRELSCCAINTTVTIPNIPLVAVVDRALAGSNLPLVGRFIPRLINRAIQSLREQLFVRKQVREILFEGYEVELLKMVSRVGSLVGLPQTQQRFALLKGRNDSWRPEQDGVFAINTGASDRRKFGKVASWNSYKQLPFWSAPSCNTINGSDGTLFPPPIRRDEPLYIFNAELCRTVNLVYKEPSEIRSIQALRFVLNPMNFAHTMEPAASAPAPSSSLSSSSQPSLLIRRSQPQPNKVTKPNLHHHDHEPPTAPATRMMKRETRENQMRHVEAAQERHLAAAGRSSPRNPNTCFCERKNSNLNGANVCEYDGLIDLSKCTKQAQVIFGSMPHFHLGDPRLARQVSGMEPNASRHTTYLDIEPNTGLVLGGKRRVQLNLLIKRNNEVDGFENINDMLVPLVWFEESAMIPEESAQKFRSLYTDRIRLVNLVLTTLFLASIGLLAIDARLILAQYNSSQLKWRPAQVADGRRHQRSSSNTLLASAAKKAPSAAAAAASKLADPGRRLLGAIHSVKVPFDQVPGNEPQVESQPAARSSVAATTVGATAKRETTRTQTNGSSAVPLLVSPQSSTSEQNFNSSRSNSFSSSQDSAGIIGGERREFRN